MGTQDEHRALLVVFLRGGADGLTLVPPIHDDDYHRTRPLLSIDAREALPLEGPFGLNPALSELWPLYREGQLAIVVACGSEDDTRSHFEAQDLMERAGRDVGGGWLGRFLRARLGAGSSSGLPAVAVGSALPESLRGAPGALALRSVEDLAASAPDAELAHELSLLYEADALLAAPASDALHAAARLRTLAGSPYSPAHGASYGSGPFALGLREVARLYEARAGLVAACVDLPGWDSHVFQASLMEPLMRQLSTGLSAFCRDLGPALSGVSIVVMSEFGRRLAENSALGTDHGRGTVMMILGGGVTGGVHGRWPGLSPDALEGPGDVAVAQNFRDVLAAVLARHGDAPMETVFPGHVVRPIPL